MRGLGNYLICTAVCRERGDWRNLFTLHGVHLLETSATQLKGSRGKERSQTEQV